MCIIIAKPSGAKLPSEEILDNCFTSNRDGIGFAFNKPGGKPIISKGFASVKNLIKMWDTFNIGQEHNLLVHFRLATHGKKDQGNCHPFPLTYDFEDMRRLHCSCDTAITHNGVFGGMKTNEKYSDTMKFISGILASPEVIENIQSQSVQELIRGYCGHSSKLAFLRTDGISTVGDFEKDDGIMYSNKQYKTWATRHTYNCNEWEDGKKYCQEHKIWDKCHNTWNLMDLRITCEWCRVKENVRYDMELKANICSDCKLIYAGYQD